jgi:hypothetical protein
MQKIVVVTKTPVPEGTKCAVNVKLHKFVNILATKCQKINADSIGNFILKY